MEPSWTRSWGRCASWGRIWSRRWRDNQDFIVMSSMGSIIITEAFLVEFDLALKRLIFRSRKQCHTSYVTKFKPHQEEVCDEKFVKKCSIRFLPQYVNNTIRDCYKPWYKKCSNKGSICWKLNLKSKFTIIGLTNIISNIKKSEISTNQTQHCVTEYHSVCQTQPLYNNTGKINKSIWKHLKWSLKDLMETKCKKIPRKLCGPGCGFIQGNETCLEKVSYNVKQQETTNFSKKQLQV